MPNYSKSIGFCSTASQIYQFVSSVFMFGFLSLFSNYRDTAYFWRKLFSGLYNTTIEARKCLMRSSALPERNIDDIFPGINSVLVSLVDYKKEYGEMPLRELLLLCQIARAIAPRKIFEIGTYLGGTTLQLAANSNSTIYTLDLPPETPREVVDTDLDVYPGIPGVRFQNKYNDTIIQLFGDSQTFDFSPFYGKIDFIFVDGCHQYEHVVWDSKNAMKMKSKNGVIIWHDYAIYAPGVMQALDELKDGSLVHISNSSLVCSF